MNPLTIENAAEKHDTARGKLFFIIINWLSKKN